MSFDEVCLESIMGPDFFRSSILLVFSKDFLIKKARVSEGKSCKQYKMFFWICSYSSFWFKQVPYPLLRSNVFDLRFYVVNSKARKVCKPLSSVSLKDKVELYVLCAYIAKEFDLKHFWHLKAKMNSDKKLY